MLYPARITFRREREIKNFSNKEKLKEKSNTRPILKEILRSSLIIKESRRQERENHNCKVNHLNKPIYRPKRKKKGFKSFYESDDKHKEWQKDKHEEVTEDIKMII